MNTAAKKSDLPVYTAAVLLGISAGYLDARIGDLLLTALLVLLSTMMLGILRPERPWRWLVIVGTCVPAMMLLAYLLFTEKPYRAQIYESFLGFLTGAAGAYGGATARRAMREIFLKR
jgi:hypothetical protein